MKDYMRPMRITHEYMGYSENMSYEDKLRITEKRIRSLKEAGYGGIVTNVSFDNDYLENETEWKLIREKARICHENDMRMWLYDENGYPSGGAGGKTVHANPDFEARALVMARHRLKKGETYKETLPHGHEKILAGYAFKIKGDELTDSELSQMILGDISFSDNSCKYTNNTDDDILALTFFEKHMYEGGHCRNNVCSARRYLDVSNRDAVREFINNTYVKYTEHAGDLYSGADGDLSYHGENALIEAIFTDEPSYMGVYLNIGLNPPKTDDPYDDTIPFLPMVSYGRDVANEFSSRFGYKIEENMQYLFFGGDEKAQEVRKDYYTLMSDLYEEAYFSQIGDYCASVGLNFSGHILLEDDLVLHVPFEGNYFNLLRHMHVPGIDMLHSVPEIVHANAFTPILVRSVADLYGRTRVMDEVSAHAQGGNVTDRQMFISMMLQFCFGADQFTSYYQERGTVEEQRKIWDKITFAEEKVGTRSHGNALLYYPIETMMRLRKPSIEEVKNTDNGDPLMHACQDNMIKGMYTLLDTGTPFVFTDTGSLKIAAKRAPELFIIGGCIIEDELLIAIRKLKNNGCRIVYFCPSEAFKSEFEKISEYAVPAFDENELKNEIANACGEWITGNSKGIAAVYSDSGKCAIVTNSTGEEKELTVRGKYKAATALWRGEPAKLSFDSENNDSTKFVLPPYEAVILEE